MGRPGGESVVREWDTKEAEGVQLLQGWELEMLISGQGAKGPPCKPTLWRILRGAYDEIESCFCRIIRGVRSRKNLGLREKSWYEARSHWGIRRIDMRNLTFPSYLCSTAQYTKREGGVEV